MLHPQNGDCIVTTGCVTSLHPVYNVRTDGRKSAKNMLRRGSSDGRRGVKTPVAWYLYIRFGYGARLDLRGTWMPLNRMNRQRRSDANRNGDHEQPTPWRRGAGSGTFRTPSLFSGLRRFVAYASCGGVVPAGGHVTTSRTYHFHKSMNFWKFSSSKVAYSSRFVLIL